VHFLEFIAGRRASCHYLVDVAESIVEVKNSYLFTIFSNSNFILLLDSCIIYKSRMAFLQLDEGHMLMYGLLYKRISLMVLLHQHN
jgi:hypothetical protein